MIVPLLMYSLCAVVDVVFSFHEAIEGFIALFKVSCVTQSHWTSTSATTTLLKLSPKTAVIVGPTAPLSVSRSNQSAVRNGQVRKRCVHVD